METTETSVADQSLVVSVNAAMTSASAYIDFCGTGICYHSWYWLDVYQEWLNNRELVLRVFSWSVSSMNWLLFMVMYFVQNIVISSLVPVLRSILLSRKSRVNGDLARSDVTSQAAMCCRSCTCL